MTDQKKYEFVPGDEIVIAPGRTLKRIRALIAITAISVSPGDLGGYIENEKNLARVSGDAWVHGNARVYGDAWVSGNADWLIVGPAKSSGRFTTAFKDKKIGIRVSCGCFTGTVREFAAAIEKTHCETQEHLQQYRLFCQLIAFNFGVEPACT